jgi:inositol oxygenase
MKEFNNTFTNLEKNPLKSLDEWEEAVIERYPEPGTKAIDKTKEEYRNYEDPARDTVKEFYRPQPHLSNIGFCKPKKSRIFKI